MSFIDLMANHVWSDADIVRRTEAVIASQFPNVEILRRKVEGQLLGHYTMTADEQTQLASYQATSVQAGQDADAARADMTLLLQTMQLEQAQRDVALDPQNTDAQAIVDAAPQPVRDLAAARASIFI